MNFLIIKKLNKCSILFNKILCFKVLGKLSLSSSQVMGRVTSVSAINIHQASSLLQYNLISTIQVRYKNNDLKYPKLHGDIEFPNFDYYRKKEFKNVMKTKWGSGDEKPNIAYVVSFFGLLGAAYSVKSDIYFLVSYMSAAADVLAMSSIEVNLDTIPPGGCLTFKWRGKPLFIKNRTDTEIEAEINTPLPSLRDPQTQDDRCIKPDWLVVIGVCTHLGCVPIPNSGDWAGGFYCPCHGSHYDNIGRTRKGPAPTNLEVPPYKFISETTLIVG